MRYAPTARPRFILLSALLLTVLGAALVATEARPALANHGGTFSFTTTALTVDEGDTAQLPVVFTNRDVSENVNLGLNVQLISAETADVGNGGVDFCFPVQGALLSPVPIPLSTFADADLEDETLAVTLTLSSATVGCANGHAVIGGPDTLTLTIEDTGTPGAQTTYNFVGSTSTALEGTDTAVLVRRSGDTSGAGSVLCAVAAGTAEPSDISFAPNPKTMSFSAGETTDEACGIELNQDVDDDNETVVFTLSGPVGGVLGTTTTHTLTIVDDDAPTVQFGQPTYTVTENDVVATFNVTRSSSSGTASVNCSAAEGTADSPSDFQSFSNQLISFANGDSSEPCSVTIEEDVLSEGTETFVLTLSNPVGANLGLTPSATVSITDDDTGPNVYTFQSGTYSVQESAGTVTVTVVRSTNAGTGAVSWDITGGTATAGSDYIDASGTVNFTAGQTQQSFAITIVTSVAAEANETIIITLLDPVSGTLGNPSQTTVTITEIGVPTVTDVTPDNIPTAGGTSVVITGTNFTGATSVMFGAVNATSFVVNNANQITAVAPARQPGTYDVRVTTPAGTSANTAADDITYGGTETVTYQLSTRWSLIAWLGKNNVSIQSALQGNAALTAGFAQSAPNNILSTVTAVATWHNAQQRYLFWFPAGSGVPGANDITTFTYGTPYWIAVTTNITWVVVEGP